MKNALVVAGLASSACSILYNPNNIDRDSVDAARPDAGDGGLDDASNPNAVDMLIDVPPGQLVIDAIEPGTVYEGVGTGGSRKAVVVIDVRNLVAGTPVVTAAPIADGSAMKSLTIGNISRATDGSMIAFEVTVPVLDESNEGMTKDVVLRVEQPDDPSNFSEITLHVTALDQFSPPAGTINTQTQALRSLYSTIVINNNIHFVGPSPAILRSTSSVTINAIVDVNGSGTTPGASGCGGGSANVAQAPTAGGCGVGGGKAGAAGSAPGGGGGFGAAGGGAGGQPTGEPLLVTLNAAAGVAANRGNGGGGGWALLGGAGEGGAGAGALEVTADGTLTIGTNGRVQAIGGNGATPAGLAAGGGGSGGAIIVRAPTVAQSATGWLSATGGSGGGTGGVGRVRIDTTTLDIASMVSAPAPARGIHWRTTTPTIVTSESPTLELVGRMAQSYGISVNGASVTPVIADNAGVILPAVPLTPGHNRLCATVGATVQIGQVSSTRCVDVAYLP